jgi:hypothetical protein
MSFCRRTYTLSHKVGVDLLLEGGLVEVSGSNSNTEGDGLLLGLSGNVLPDGDGRVDTLSSLEEGTNGTSGSLGGDKDNVNVGGDVDLGQLLEDRGESVGEVEGLSLKLGLNGGPGLGLGSVGEKVHDDGSLGDSLVNLEEVLSGDPSILDGLVPGGSVLADSDDDVHSVVTEVKSLSVS